MLSFFPPDVLHTVTKGSVEYGIGFALQCISYISELDSNYKAAPKRLAVAIRSFPGYHSLQPVRHFRFENIWDLYISKDSKQKGNPLNSTGLITMKHSYKLPAALVQILFACTDTKIVPHDFGWSKAHGFQEPYFSPGQAICNTLNAILDVYLYCTAQSLSEMQIVTFQLLISNMQSQMLVLDYIRKRIITRGKTSVNDFEDVKMDEVNLMTNPKLELLRHMPQSKRLSGCVNDVRDTSAGELMMQYLRVLFNSTTKRYETVLLEMLRKSFNMLILNVVRKGAIHRSIIDNIGPRVKDAKKIHNKSKTRKKARKKKKVS